MVPSKQPLRAVAAWLYVKHGHVRSAHVKCVGCTFGKFFLVPKTTADN